MYVLRAAVGAPRHRRGWRRLQGSCVAFVCAAVHRVCAVGCNACARAHVFLLCFLSLQRIYHCAFHEYAIYTPIECVMLCISPAKLQLQSSQVRRGLPVSPRRRGRHRSERFLIYFVRYGVEEPLSIWNHVEFFAFEIFNLTLI